ncbi:hypothetical protein [Aristophania vespae]|uniref:hypothetical protein n=1 Tax=Aristophania vespae TaxID=2697033 RepID=UPI0023518C91|nr:hypothetical protein [Aristophania vespae]UMM63158.1 hypothetical protein DM15PD_01130 [Aristophania vespae]
MSTKIVSPDVHASTVERGTTDINEYLEAINKAKKTPLEAPLTIGAIPTNPIQKQADNVSAKDISSACLLLNYIEIIALINNKAAENIKKNHITDRDYILSNETHTLHEVGSIFKEESVSNTSKRASLITGSIKTLTGSIFEVDPKLSKGGTTSQSDKVGFSPYSFSKKIFETKTDLSNGVAPGFKSKALDISEKAIDDYNGKAVTNSLLQTLYQKETVYKTDKHFVSFPQAYGSKRHTQTVTIVSNCNRLCTDTLNKNSDASVQKFNVSDATSQKDHDVSIVTTGIKTDWAVKKGHFFKKDHDTSVTTTGLKTDWIVKKNATPRRNHDVSIALSGVKTGWTVKKPGTASIFINHRKQRSQEAQKDFDKLASGATNNAGILWQKDQNQNKSGKIINKNLLHLFDKFEDFSPSETLDVIPTLLKNASDRKKNNPSYVVCNFTTRAPTSDTLTVFSEYNLMAGTKLPAYTEQPLSVSSKKPALNTAILSKQKRFTQPVATTGTDSPVDTAIFTDLIAQLKHANTKKLVTKHKHISGLIQFIPETTKQNGLNSYPNSGFNEGQINLRELLKKYDGNKIKTENAHNWETGSLNTAIKHRGNNCQQYEPQNTRNYIHRTENHIKSDVVVRIENNTGQDVSVSARRSARI